MDGADLDARRPGAQPELLRSLREDPHSFGFFQVVRMLEQLFPGRQAVGGFGDPGEEVVRFSVNPVISFPASEIQTLDLDEGGASKMRVNFMGLVGPLGVLPYYYTLLVAERLRERDTTLLAFLDMFQHRMISLFYQAWKKHRFEVAFESRGRDRITPHLLDAMGLGTKATQARQAVPDEALLFYTGLLAPHQRSAVALEQLVGDYFAVPVRVEQFIGGWYSLTEPSQCRLDRGRDPSIQLGRGAVVGDEIWDPHARVRVRLGPLPRRRYEEFLPGGRGHAAMRALSRFYGNDQYDFELQLVLARDEVPGFVLGADDPALPLGWLSWIRTAPFTRNPDDTVLTL